MRTITRHVEISSVPTQFPHYYDTLLTCCNGRRGDLYTDILNTCPKTDDLYCFKSSVQTLSKNSIPNTFYKIWESLPLEAKEHSLNHCPTNQASINYITCFSKLLKNADEFFNNIPGFESTFNEYQINLLEKLANNLHSYSISASGLMKVCMDQSASPLTITETDKVKEKCGDAVHFPIQLTSNYNPLSLPADEDSTIIADPNLENLRSSNFAEASEARGTTQSIGNDDGDFDEQFNSLAPIINPNLFQHGASNYDCPDYMKPYNCVQEGSDWSLSGRLGENISQDNGRHDALVELYRDVEDVLISELANHKKEKIIESYLLGLSSLNPTNPNIIKQKGREIINAAQNCLPPESLAKYERVVDQAVSIGPTQKAQLDRHRREVLAPDLILGANQYMYAQNMLEDLQPRFEMDGECGIFGKSDYDCMMKHHWRQVHLATQNRITTTYPFLQLETENGSNLLNKLFMIENEDFYDHGFSDPGNGEFKRELLSESDIDQALQHYDEISNRSLEMSKDALVEACSNSRDAGLSVLTNPFLTQSYFQNEENQQKGWAFCTLYAISKQDEAHWNLLKTSGAITLAGASIVFTGGTAGWALLAIDAAVLSSDTYDRYYNSHNQMNDYIAGVGNLASYNQASNTLDDFIFWTAVDSTLFAIGGIGEVVNLSRKLSIARKIAHASGDSQDIARFQEISEEIGRSRRQALESTNNFSPESLRNLSDEELVRLFELYNKNPAALKVADGTPKRTHDQLREIIYTDEITELRVKLQSEQPLVDLNTLTIDEIRYLDRLNEAKIKVKNTEELQSYLQRYNRIADEYSLSYGHPPSETISKFITSFPEVSPDEFAITLRSIERGTFPQIPESLSGAKKLSRRNSFIDQLQATYINKAKANYTLSRSASAYPGGANTKSLVDVDASISRMRQMCGGNVQCIDDEYARRFLSTVEEDSFIEFFGRSAKNNRSKSPYTAGAIDPKTGIYSVRKNVNEVPEDIHSTLSENIDQLNRNYSDRISESVSNSPDPTTLADKSPHVSIQASNIPGVHAEVLAASDVLNFKKVLSTCFESRSCTKRFACFNDTPISCNPADFDNINFDPKKIDLCRQRVAECFPPVDKPENLFFDVRGTNSTTITSQSKITYESVQNRRDFLNKNISPRIEKKKAKEILTMIDEKCKRNTYNSLCKQAYMNAVHDFCKSNNCSNISPSEDLLTTAKQTIIGKLGNQTSSGETATTMGAGHRCFNCWHILGQENFNGTLDP